MLLKKLHRNIINWQINKKENTDLNYKIIQFSLLIKKTEFVKSSFSLSFNINKADWKLSKENLKREEENVLNNIQYLLKNSWKLNLKKQQLDLKNSF